jgi:dienelactone hydrolase
MRRLCALVYVLPLCTLASCSRSGSQPKPVDRTAAAEAWVDLLVAGKYADAEKQLDAAMTRALPEGKLKETWEGLAAQVGPFQKRTVSRADQQGGFDLVFVTCQFEKTPLAVKVVFDKDGKVGGLWFVPTDQSAEYQLPAYAKPNAYTEREVTVGQGEWALPGTLTVPKGEGPFPAVVLVHGSGPQDRDETIGPNKPFRDLSAGLATRGMAVLRYEKRTKEHGADMLATLDRLTVKEETVDDALAAVALLRKTKEIDPERIFVLGHSQGGTFAPRIGAADPKIAGLIIMAGTVRPLEDILVDQLSYVLPLEVKDPAEVAKQLAVVKEQVARVKDPKLSIDTPRDKLPLGVPASYWLDVRDYDPAKAAQALKQRILVLQGGRDYQATTADFDLWKAALAGRKNVTLKLYPNLNHLFAPGNGKATPAEYMKGGQHVSEEVIADIAGWIGPAK